MVQPPNGGGYLQATPSGAERDTRPPWAALLLRLFVLVVSGQWIGTFVFFTLLPIGLLGTHPGLVNLSVVCTGGLPGVLVGLLVRPVPHRLPTYLGLCAGSAVVAWLLLQLVSTTGSGSGVPPLHWWVYVVGPLATATVQSTVAGLVRRWFSGHR